MIQTDIKSNLTIYNSYEHKFNRAIELIQAHKERIEKIAEEFKAIPDTPIYSSRDRFVAIASELEFILRLIK